MPRPKPVRKRTVEAGGDTFSGGARGPVRWLGKRIVVRQQLRLLHWVTGLNRSRSRALGPAANVCSQRILPACPHRHLASSYTGGADGEVGVARFTFHEHANCFRGAEYVPI
jgi:hypothetical protein